MFADSIVAQGKSKALSMELIEHVIRICDMHWYPLDIHEITRSEEVHNGTVILQIADAHVSAYTFVCKKIGICGSQMWLFLIQAKSYCIFYCVGALLFNVTNSLNRV